MNNISYNEKIYSLDIETSTYIIDNPVVNKVAEMYCYAVTRCDFKTQLNNNRVENIERVRFGRTYASLNSLLNNIYDDALYNNYCTIIYVHNLSYDFSFIHKNCNIFEILSKHNRIKILGYNKSNYFQVMLCDDDAHKKPRIEFRCSLTLTGYSIKKLGELYNYSKLDYEYRKQRNQETLLTTAEIEYNYRDTEIALLGICGQCKMYSWLKSINDIPLTKTSFTRKNNKHITNNQIRQLNKRDCNNLLPLTDAQYSFVKNAYNGGYVGANPYKVTKVLHNVASIDITSSYPNTLINYNYPDKFLREVTGADAQKLIEKWLDIYSIDFDRKNIEREFKKKVMLEHYKHYGLGNKSYIFDVMLLNVNSNTFDNDNIMLMQNASSTIDQDHRLKQTTRVVLKDKHTKVYNKKVVNSNAIRICVTDVSLYDLLMLYDVDEILCFRALEYKNSKPKPYMVSLINYYLSIKSIYKDLNKINDATKGNRLVNSKDIKLLDTNNFISDVVINDIISTKDVHEQHKKTSMYLLRSKADLNAQYGINVQDYLQNDLLFKNNTIISDVDKTYNMQELKNKEYSYLTGVWCTAYARHTLMSMFLTMTYKSDCTLIYSDTDSLKFALNNTSVDDFKSIVNQYNNLWLQRHTALYNTIDSKYKLGTFDFEYIYHDFCTLGSKRYIGTKETKSGNMEIECKLSGVRNADEIYNKLYLECGNNFEKMITNYFHSGVIFQKNKTIPNRTAYDKNIYYKYGVSGIVLVDSDVSINIITHTDEAIDINKEILNDVNVLCTYFSNTARPLNTKTKTYINS